jgi:hypothetical protein
MLNGKEKPPGNLPAASIPSGGTYWTLFEHHTAANHSPIFSKPKDYL